MVHLIVLVAGPIGVVVGRAKRCVILDGMAGAEGLASTAYVESSLCARAAFKASKHLRILSRLEFL